MPLQVNSKNSANCEHWSNFHVYLKSNPIHWVQDNALCVLSASIAQVAGRKVNANMIYIIEHGVTIVSKYLAQIAGVIFLSVSWS